MPLCLILKKINNLHQEYSFSNMSSELIPLFPSEETFYVNPKIPELGTRSVEVKRKQFPLTPAYAFTAYKAQGKTLDKVIIDLSRPPTGSLDSAYAYVALSRSKSLNGIAILRDFNEQILNMKYGKNYNDEIIRLNDIEFKNNINNKKIFNHSLIQI